MPFRRDTCLGQTEREYLLYDEPRRWIDPVLTHDFRQAIRYQADWIDALMPLNLVENPGQIADAYPGLSTSSPTP